MSRKVPCTSCHRKIRLTDELMGRKVRCRCGSEFRMPGSKAEATVDRGTATPRPLPSLSKIPATIQPAQIISCWSCSTKFEVKNNLVGSSFRCHCGEDVHVPLVNVPITSATENQNLVAPELITPEVVSERVTPMQTSRRAAAPTTPTARTDASLASYWVAPQAKAYDSAIHGPRMQRLPSLPEPNYRSKLPKTQSSHQGGGDMDGWGNLAIGGIILLVGSVVTIGSYQAAGPGGTFVLAWGAILFGGIQFVRGLLQVASS